MSAFLKLYSDVGHTTEIAHTANVSNSLNGATIIGATQITLNSVVGMPAQGYIDIDTAGLLETVQYTLITGNVLTLAKALANAHNSAVAVVQWYYLLTLG